MSSENYFTAKGRFQSHQPTPAARRAANEQRGFTLTELVAVIAAVGLLALVALPAFAGARIKGARALCGANQHQMFVASMVYANEFGTRLPPWRAGLGSQQNDIPALQYTRWLGAGFPRNYRIPIGFSLPPGAAFQNMGYLYGANLVGDGNIFYCPALTSGPFSEFYYSPLPTPDSGGGNPGSWRSSFNYNPRIVNSSPTNGAPVNTHRRFQDTSQFEPHRVFSIDQLSGQSGFGAHSVDQGWNVCFTDGSVKFCKPTSPQAARLARDATSDGNYAARELLFDLFEGM